ncbi:hypothetical protein ACTFIU_006659 [Dictyostelium citrinum]
MSKTKTIISLICILLAFIFSTATFSMFRYQIGYDDVDYFYRFNGVLKIKYSSYGNVVDSQFKSYTEDDKELSKNLIFNLDASLAFDILAWNFFLVAMILLLIELFVEVKDFKKLQTVCKYILFLATGCILLSVFIILVILLYFYQGVSSARKKDCLQFSKGLECYSKNFNLFYQYKDYHQIPGASWYLSIISAIFSIPPTIINLFGSIRVGPKLNWSEF